MNNKSQRKYKYLSAESGLDDSAFRNNKGYWIYSNQSGNLTLPGVGGSTSGQSYSWSKLRFANSSGFEKNITEAATANWIVMTLKYSDTSDGSFKSISNQEEDIHTISAWQGIFVYSYKDNLTIIRQN